MLRKWLVLALLCSACASAPVKAQSTVTIAWDQAGPDLPTVQGYTYKLYVNAAPPVMLTATCVAGGTVDPTVPFSCTATPLTEAPGPYTVQATASNAAGESLKSTPLSFTLVGLPAVPTNVRKR